VDWHNILPPRANRLAHTILEISTRICGYGEPGHVRFDVKAGATDEWCQLILDLLVARLIPLDRQIIHLVDHDDDLVNAGSLDEHDVLARLPALLEARLELAFTRGDDEQRDVRLGGAGYHRGDVRLVARCIEDRISPRVRLKVRAADLDRLALGTLQWRRVERPGEVPGLPAGFLRLTLVLLHRALVHHPRQEEDVPSHRAFPGIHVPDKNDVQVLLDCRRPHTAPTTSFVSRVRIDGI